MIATSLLLAASLLAAKAAPAIPEAGRSAQAATGDSPWVVVDYSARTGSYRVVGDVSLLSQRYTPGTTFGLIIAAIGLESGEITGSTQIPCRDTGDPSRTVPLTISQAIQESNDDFFSQLLKRTGYEPVRKFLVATRYTPGVPEAVASFADLAKGEPLRVTVFEQNLFLQAFLRRELPVSAEHYASLERWLSMENGKGTWGKGGTGEISPEPQRHVSWFNGVARLKDGAHVITVAAVTPRRDSTAQDRFRRYLATPRR